MADVMMDLSLLNTSLNLTEDRLAAIRLRMDRTIASAMYNTGKKVKADMKTDLAAGRITKYPTSAFTANSTYLSPVEITQDGTTTKYSMRIGLKPIAQRYMRFAEFGGEERPINGMSRNIIMPGNIQTSTHVTPTQREIMGMVIEKERGKVRSRHSARRQRRAEMGEDNNDGTGGTRHSGASGDNERNARREDRREEQRARRHLDDMRSGRSSRRHRDSSGSSHYKAHYFFGTYTVNGSESALGLYYASNRFSAPKLILRAKRVVNKHVTGSYIATATRYARASMGDEMQRSLANAISRS